jgi:hypothetical protein
VVAMQVSKQYMIDFLRRWGYREVADEAERDLPDPVELSHAQEWAERHGISRGELIDRMGGSP